MTQVLGSPSQSQPASTLQVELQPSPGVMLPSSQPSPLSIAPSPHTATVGIGVQTLGSPTQVYPGSTTHAAEQPSPLIELASSQVSLVSSAPLPQERGTSSIGSFGSRSPG